MKFIFAVIAAGVVAALGFRILRAASTKVFAPNATAAARLSYMASCQRLQEKGLLPPGDLPPMPPRMPRFDDDPVHLSFFRTNVTGEHLDNMTLPRTFFGRSSVSGTSFCNTDLSESVLCWNDFDTIDFSAADLSGSDLRAANFRNCDFSQADLSRSDLRQSSFDRCRFAGAVLTGAKLTNGQVALLRLSSEQRSGVAFQADDGPEPGGG